MVRFVHDTGDATMWPQRVATSVALEITNDDAHEPEPPPGASP
jgi:hypothetical protein